MEQSEYTPGAIAKSLKQKRENKRKTKIPNPEENIKLESMFSKSFPIKETKSKLAEKKEEQKSVSKKKKRKLTNTENQSSPEKRKKTCEDLTPEDETPKKQKKQLPDPDRDKRTIFVGNISNEVSKKQLVKMFRKFGKVESVRLRSGTPANPKLPKKAAIIKKEFHPSKPCINAYVVFSEQQCVEDALALNNEVLDGRHLRVDRMKSDKSDVEHNLSVFVGNLPLDAEEEELRQHFEGCGNVANVRIIRDQTTGLGKGFGFILFAKKSSIPLALKLHGEEFNNRKLRIMKSTDKPDKSHPKKKKQSRGRTERSEKFRQIRKNKEADPATKTTEKKQPKSDNVKAAFKEKKLLHKKKIKRRLASKHKKKVANILTGKPKKKS